MNWNLNELKEWFRKATHSIPREHWGGLYERLNFCITIIEQQQAKINNLERIIKVDHARDCNWLDPWGCCKVCDGEIPHGHDEKCDIYKLESEITCLKNRMMGMVEKKK